MTRSLVVFTLAAAAAGSPGGFAQEVPARAPVQLTLAEAVERARHSSPRLAQLRALQSAADASLRGARAGRLPMVDLQASYTRYSSVPELVLAIPGTGPQTVFPNIPNQYRARAGVTLPLYTGGRVAGEIEAARNELAAAGKDVDTGLSDLVLETITAYWSLVSARENARVLAESVASYEADLKQVQDRFDVGMAARNDVLNVQVERDRAELSRLEAHNDAEVENENLVRLLGLDPGSRVEPTEPVAAPTATGESVEALVARAIEGRPEIAGLRARAAAADASVKIARSPRRPQLSLSAAYDYARPNTRILPFTDSWNDSWNIGASVSLLAFDGGRTSAAVAQARAQADATRRQLEDLERRVRLDVTSRALDLSTHRSALDVAERNLDAARENVRVSQDRYREGLIPASELLDAQSRLLQAGLQRTRSATRLQQARANLDRAVGR
jgi:outer membrane protein TolC